jgi:hypothetical protein
LVSTASRTARKIIARSALTYATRLPVAWSTTTYARERCRWWMPVVFWSNAE